MSKRAWALLIGLFLLSLLVAGGVAWVLPQARPTFGHPIPGPTYHAPWYRGEPPRFFWPEEQGRPGPLFPRGRPRFFTRPHPLWHVGRVLASEIFFFLAAALVVLLFPGRITRSARIFWGDGHAWAALGVGVLVSLIMLVLSVLAALSALGLMFLPWLLMLYGFAWAVGLVVVALAVGRGLRRLFRVPDARWLLDLALGVLLLITVGLIPVLGWVVLLLAGLWGVGAVALTRFGASRGWQLDILWQEEGGGDHAEVV